jgi:hypothetical protein
VDALLFPHSQSQSQSHDFGFWACWSVAGCGFGLLVGAILPFFSSRWWALLIVPALVDGWLVLQIAIGMGIASMH